MIYIDVEFSDYTEYDREMLLNGCGGADGPHINLCFKPACDLHDHRYRCGFTEEHRGEWDSEFHQYMHRIIDDIESEIDNIAWWRFISRFVMEKAVRALREAADLYYFLVTEFGEKFFHYREDSLIGDDVYVTMETLHEEEKARQQEGIRSLSPLANCLMRAA